MPNYIPASASTLADMDVAALSRVAWRSKTKEDSVRPSIWTAVKTIFQVLGDEMMILEHGIVLDVKNEGKRSVGGGQSVRCALTTGFRKPPQEGTAEDMLGNGDEGSLYYAEFHYNEIKKAYKQSNWGYDANDLEYLAWKDGNSKRMGQYWMELNDYRYQVALLMGYSPELIKTPTNKVQFLNPNWCIPSLATSSYPAWAVAAVTETDGSADADGWYSSQLYTGGSSFAENVADSLTAAGTSATATIDNLMEIFDYIEDEHVVEPVMIDGQPTWIFKVPTKVYNWMMNPNNSGSVGEYFKSVLEYKDEKRMTIPGEMGRLFGSWLIVKDPRCPTLTLGGNNGSYTLTPGYIRPSNNDDRNRSAWSAVSGATNYAFDIGAILGAEALAEYVRDDLTNDMVETTEFKKRQETGSYMGSGVQLCRYDKGTPSASSIIYRGSAIIPFARTRVSVG